MNVYLWSILLAMLGAILGSFAGAMVWRLRAGELKYLKDANQDYSKKEYNQLASLAVKTMQSDRSMCLKCHHDLRWYDLIPIFSWVSLKGKCRYCHHKIGNFEPLMEISLAFLFVSSYLLWPFSLVGNLAIASFLVWLIACVVLVIIFAYDLKWFLIPSVVSYSLIGLGAIFALLNLWQSGFWLSDTFYLFGAVAILSGIYLFIFLISRGAWIGFGDILIGFGLSFFLMTWQQAFLCLFISNLVGTLVVIPGLIMGKLKRTSRVPFGPFLIVGFIITFYFGDSILSLLFSQY